MTDNTINNDMTIGGATGAILAGRYRVVRQLGQGGMGSVWLAEDEKLDGFKVAIKMLPSVLVNNKRAYAQVKAEALVSLKLSHPNSVTVRAFEEEGGSPFLVMDYIDGQTLDDYLAEKGRLTEEETVKLLKPVAAVLDYAHTQGVVHRDVKPGNVMIRKDGTPFVLDFGIAREIQETMTRVTGKLSSGTLLYMSPEQLRGAIPTPAQDIYSFAAMAYECLAGNPPFARGQIEYQIEHVEPTPLGPQFANCGPGVMAGLEKKQENRPASCIAVLAPTRGNGGGRSPRPAPGGRQETPRSPDRTAGGKGLIIGLVVALVFAGAGAYHYISVKNAERSRLSEAQVTFERALTSLNEYERKIEKLSREDGFGSRIDEINEKIPSRIALKDVSSFLSAAECCSSLEKECRQLLAADELRIQAKTVRDTAQQAKQKAQGQYASQEAKQTWQAAESAYEQGRREFSQFDFEKAVQSFTLSGQHYEKAASEAAAAREERQKVELARQEQKAKEDELRKKNEKEIADLREACMSAKKAAEDAEASEFASKEMATAVQLLADAEKAAFRELPQTHPRNDQLVAKLLSKDVAPEGYKKSGRGYMRLENWDEISRRSGYVERFASFCAPDPRYIFMLKDNGDDTYSPLYVIRPTGVRITGDDLVIVSEADKKELYQNARKTFELAQQLAIETSKPKVTLKAVLDGEEVNATVVSGLKDKTRKTPVTVDLSGWDIGSSLEFKIAYTCRGIPYEGVGRYSVKKGTKLLSIELTISEAERMRRENERRRKLIVGTWKVDEIHEIDMGDGHGDISATSATFDFQQDGCLIITRRGVEDRLKWRWGGDVLEIYYDPKRKVILDDGEFVVRWEGDNRFVRRYANVEKRRRMLEGNRYNNVKFSSFGYDSNGYLIKCSNGWTFKSSPECFVRQ